jgi:hypothetical protein
MLVTQDAVGDLEQPWLIGDRERFEGALIAPLSPGHEVLIHPPDLLEDRTIGPS